MGALLGFEKLIDSQIKHPSNMQNRIVENCSSLRFQPLKRLCEGEILALRIPAFFSKSECQQILLNLNAKNSQLGKYDNASELNIYRLGMSHFETRFNPSLVDKYFSSSIHFPGVFSKLCSPVKSPFERLLSEFESIWPGGVAPQMLDEKRMMPGLVRVIGEDQIFPPHQDLLTRDCPRLPQDEHPLSQLAVNVYLQNFEDGGELEVWDYAPDDEEVKSLYTGTHDFIDREKIPIKSHRIKPEPGDLILIQSGKLHAVRSGSGGKRVAFSCFVANRGTERPLTYWI